jgi:hypothetical protein
MPGNRRRNANAVPLLSMAAWIVVCLFFGGMGLGYVAMKSQLHASGTEIKQLEKEIGELQTQNQVVKAHIADLSSTDTLRKRFNGDKTHLNGLVEIPQDKLVFVGRPQPKVVENEIESERELRKIANRETHP